jgi:hypothetical protein
MIGTFGLYDFEEIVKTKGRLVRLPKRRDRGPEPSAPVMTVRVTNEPEETIVKTNGTTLKSRTTSVMAGVDKHITTGITINGTVFTQTDRKALFQSQITTITTNEALRESLADGVANAGAIGVKVLVRAPVVGFCFQRKRAWPPKKRGHASSRIESHAVGARTVSHATTSIGVRARSRKPSVGRGATSARNVEYP